MMLDLVLIRREIAISHPLNQGIARRGYAVTLRQ
jgi:hypothetical protein